MTPTCLRPVRASRKAGRRDRRARLTGEFSRRGFLVLLRRSAVCSLLHYALHGFFPRIFKFFRRRGATFSDFRFRSSTPTLAYKTGREWYLHRRSQSRQKRERSAATAAPRSLALRSSAGTACGAPLGAVLFRQLSSEVTKQRFAEMFETSFNI